jgi:hypothetical protein
VKRVRDALQIQEYHDGNHERDKQREEGELVWVFCSCFARKSP